MFRGVLYRHLREASASWRWLPSVIFSGTVSSFIFAIVHPQGIVAVPVLMALAYGFDHIVIDRGERSGGVDADHPQV